MSTESRKQVQLAIDAVRTLEFNVQQFNAEEMEVNNEVGFEISFGLKPLNIATGILSVVLHINYKLERISEAIASVEIACDFHIKDLDNLKKDDKYFMPRDLFEFLVKETYATARGALIMRGAGTIIEKLVLPLMDPSEFNITKGIMFELVPSRTE